MELTAERESKTKSPVRPAKLAPSRLMLQRQCACGGSGGMTGECEECHSKRLHPAGSVISRGNDPPQKGMGDAGPAEQPPVPAEPAAAPPVPSAEQPAAAPAGPGAEQAPAVPEAKPAGLIVDDQAASASPGQMRKSDFLDRLEAGVCAAADSELAKAGRSSQGCPYIQRWIGYYRGRDAAQVERAIRKYAPESNGVSAAADYIPLVAARVQRAAAHWAATGEVTGVPEEVAGAAGGLGGILGGIGSAISGAVAGIFGKARPGGLRNDDPQAVQSQLGSGTSLDSGTRSRMESAFGHDFSQVRVHTDAGAARLSDSLNARAFAVGNNVAFGTGEYRPGTISGEVLLAHELAHVVQQAGAASAGPMQKGGSAYTELEADADRAAAGAVASAWGLGARAAPALRSGLSLQRCGKPTPAAAGGSDERLSVCIRPVRIADDDGKNPTTLPSFAETISIWNKCCMDVTVNSSTTVNKTDYKILDESPNDTPTAEETALFGAAGGSGGCVSVFVADQFHQGAVTGKDVSGGGGTYDGGKAEPKVVVVDGVHPTIVAHEVGHALGYGRHDPASTVMEVTASRHDQKESDKVAAVICEQVRKFMSAKATGKKECKLDV